MRQNNVGFLLVITDNNAHINQADFKDNCAKSCIYMIIFRTQQALFLVVYQSVSLCC